MPVSLDFTTAWSGQISADNIHACLHAGDPLARWSVINLVGLRWIEPAGLVAIATFAESQAQIGRRPRLYAPQSTARARYLSRMHLGRVIEELGGEHNLPATNEWDQEGRLLELQRFDGTAEAENLGRLVFERLNDDSTAMAMHTAICEIGANVPDHSGREHGYICAVTIPSSGRVSFAVGDAGVGLLEPLAGSGYTSVSAVMEDLFDRGITRTAEPGRGRGVFRTRELVNQEDGEVFLASGGATLTSTPRARRSAKHVMALPGTLLQGSMPCR